MLRSVLPHWGCTKVHECKPSVRAIAASIHPCPYFDTPNPLKRISNMSFILLKNLLWPRRQVAPSSKSEAASPAPTSVVPPISNVIIPPLSFQKKGESWDSKSTSSVDLEAQTTTTTITTTITDETSSTSTDLVKANSHTPSSSSSKITVLIREKCASIKNFRPTARMISDAIIGLSDGMTVPFALTAGLSSFGDTRIVQLGGIAELVAGMISMGVGGALGAKAESYVEYCSPSLIQDC